MTEVRWQFSERERERTPGRTQKKLTVPSGNGRARSLKFRAVGQGEYSQWLTVSEEAVDFLKSEHGDKVEVKR